METLVEQQTEAFPQEDSCVKGEDAPENIPIWLTRDLIEDAFRKGFKDDKIRVKNYLNSLFLN